MHFLNNVFLFVYTPTIATSEGNTCVFTCDALVSAHYVKSHILTVFILYLYKRIYLCLTAKINYEWCSIFFDIFSLFVLKLPCNNKVITQ